MSSAAVLVLDDDRPLRRLIASFLVDHGYAVREAQSAGEARRILKTDHVDIVVTDIMMPDEDGLSFTRSLAQRPDLGVIIISALGSETDRIVGLEVGADDYLAKPVSPRELLARIRALHRRRLSGLAAEPSAFNYHFLGWSLDPLRRTLRDPEEVIIPLSQGEFDLLLALVERPLRILTRDQLLDSLNRGDRDVFDRAVDTQISRLRKKLASRHPAEIIRTIRSEGYMFLAEVRREHQER